ncbi:hypothetical protein ACHAWF_001773, partial [Thalassiosira exigua]
DQQWHPQLSKIVATIGPTSEHLPVLQDVVRSGMGVMHLNFSHITVEEVELRRDNLAMSKGRHSVLSGSDVGNVRGVLLDTCGPELRTGKLAGDHSRQETVRIDAGSAVTPTTADNVRDNRSTANQLYVDYPKIHQCLYPGMKVLLDDGAIVLTVTEADPASDPCTANNSG